MSLCEVQEKKMMCENHGMYTSRRLGFAKKKACDWTACPECQEQKAKEAKEEERKKKVVDAQIKLCEELDSVGIRTKFHRCTFDNLVPQSEEHKRIINDCKLYVKNFEIARRGATGMIFYGRVGNGKNHLASAIAKEIMKQGKSAALMKAEYMCSDIKYFWKRGKTLSECVDDYAKTDLLIIDEITDYLATAEDQRALKNVIDARYEKNMCTILCTNCDIVNGQDSLKAIIGTAAFDRMEEASGRFYAFTWESARLKKKNPGVWG